MKNTIATLLLIVSINTFSQDIVGKWKTIDDKRGTVTSIVEIYKDHDVYYGKILLIFNTKNKEKCTTCQGKFHNKKLQGVEILRDLVKEEDTYEDGNITDPENGKTYSCYVKLEKSNKLKVRGYLGFSLLGRTQYWYRVTNEEEKQYKISQSLN